MSLVQHTPFDTEPIDVTPHERPWWMAPEEPGPKWAFRRSGEFRTVADPAFKSSTEEEGQA